MPELRRWVLSIIHTSLLRAEGWGLVVGSLLQYLSSVREKITSVWIF
jgi:hypothetical protein